MAPSHLEPNVAAHEFYEGTALANLGETLVIGAEDGDWFRVRKTDGAVLVAGNNGLQMYDLQPIPGLNGGGGVTLPEVGTSSLGLLLIGCGSVVGRRREFQAAR